MCFGARVEVDVNMPPCIICDRAFEFAARIVKLCDAMASRGFSGRHIASQLIRCGTSIGANAEEAQEGQTKPDFIAKMFVSLKEARETRYWLRLIAACRPSLVHDVAPLLAECEQLVAILTTILRNARMTPYRGK